jgi:hypothetical protein
MHSRLAILLSLAILFGARAAAIDPAAARLGAHLHQALSENSDGVCPSGYVRHDGDGCLKNLGPGFCVDADENAEVGTKVDTVSDDPTVCLGECIARLEDGSQLLGLEIVGEDCYCLSVLENAELGPIIGASGMITHVNWDCYAYAPAQVSPCAPPPAACRVPPLLSQHLLQRRDADPALTAALGP